MTGPVRLGLVTVGLVVVAALLVGVPTAVTAVDASDRVAAATGRAVGTVVAVDPGGVVVRWIPPGGPERDTVVALTAGAPPVGVRTEVAFPPADPGAAFVPGAAVLADADRAVSVLATILAVLLVVLGVSVVQVLARRRAARRPTTRLTVRRVRVEAGPIARSWLEISGRRWIPVHYDPVLTALPSPAVVTAHGDPARHRLVPVVVARRTLWPSGAVSTVEPRGRRHDNPTGPDDHAAGRAADLDRLGRRLRALLPLAAPAPVVALLWAWVDRGGALTWLATSVLLGALALWWGSLRGLDPT